MIALIQRVIKAEVRVDQQSIGKIDQGILALIGVEKGDEETNADKLLHRLLGYRIFSDSEDKPIPEGVHFCFEFDQVNKSPFLGGVSETSIKSLNLFISGFQNLVPVSVLLRTYPILGGTPKLFSLVIFNILP